jgi:hypothetical protein
MRPAVSLRQFRAKGSAGAIDLKIVIVLVLLLVIEGPFRDLTGGNGVVGPPTGSRRGERLYNQIFD